jgi:hypothetical protein
MNYHQDQSTNVKKPDYLKPDFDGIPNELKGLPQWVVWRAEIPKPGKKKWRKVPYVAQTGKPALASTTDSATWRSFDEAMSAYQSSHKWARPYDGIGFVFDGRVGDDGLCYCGFDWDAWTEPAQAQHAKLATYTELSVGGGGVHAIARAAPFRAAVCKTPDLEAEAYCEKRYFVVTGRPPNGGASDTIKARPDEITEVLAEIAAVGAKAAGEIQPAERPRSSSIRELRGSVAHLGPAQSVLLANQPFDDSLGAGIGDEFDIEKFTSAVEGLSDAWLASEANWMKLCRICANEARRSGEDKMVDALWDILDQRSRRAEGYNETDNRSRFERCLREY